MYTVKMYKFPMPHKNPYMEQSSFAISRQLFRKTASTVPQSKPIKTQNQSRDSFGRIQKLKASAARSSASFNNVPVRFDNNDPNDLVSALAKTRNIGAAVPKNAIPQ